MHAVSTRLIRQSKIIEREVFVFRLGREHGLQGRLQEFAQDRTFFTRATETFISFASGAIDIQYERDDLGGDYVNTPRLSSMSGFRDFDKGCR